MVCHSGEVAEGTEHDDFLSAAEREVEVGEVSRSVVAAKKQEPSKSRVASQLAWEKYLLWGWVAGRPGRQSCAEL